MKCAVDERAKKSEVEEETEERSDRTRGPWELAEREVVFSI